MSRAFLRKLRRVDAANPDTLIQDRQAVSVGDNGPPRDLLQGSPVQPLCRQRKKRKNRHRKHQIGNAMETTFSLPAIYAS